MRAAVTAARLPTASPSTREINQMRHRIANHGLFPQSSSPDSGPCLPAAWRRRRDLSGGLEETQVRVLSDVGPSDPPVPFKYSTSNECALPRPTTHSVLVSCSCAPGTCGEESACACRRSNYNKNELKTVGGERRLRPDDNSLCVVCGPECGCEAHCHNSLPHTSLKAVEVFMRDRQVGYGLRSLDLLDQGTVVCEMTGRILSETQLNRLSRADPSHADYAYCVADENTVMFPGYDRQRDSRVYINPYMVGNVGRFVSHGCWPNTVMVITASNTLSPSHVRVFLVAASLVQVGVELTLDYGDAHPAVRVCRCLFPFCKRGHYGRGQSHFKPPQMLALAVEVSMRERARVRRQYREEETRMEKEEKEEKEEQKRLRSRRLLIVPAGSGDEVETEKAVTRERGKPVYSSSSTAGVGVKRGRGRPRKNPLPRMDGSSGQRGTVTDAAESESVVEAVYRDRLRSAANHDHDRVSEKREKEVEQSTRTEDTEQEKTVVEGVRRGRGRPRKQPLLGARATSPSSETRGKRGRGRPRKDSGKRICPVYYRRVCGGGSCTNELQIV